MSWVEFILRPTVSRPVHLGIGLPFGAHDQILSLSFLQWQLLCCSSCRVPSLTRGRVCNLQCNRWLVRTLRTNNHTLLSHLSLCSLFVASCVSQGLRWRYSNPTPHGERKYMCIDRKHVNRVSGHMNLTGLKKEDVSWREIEMCTGLQMVFAAAVHLHEGLSLQSLLTLNVWRP
jgi:hypothetical protein